MDQHVTMFVNGQAMSGGELNDALAVARFTGKVCTAPRYRFYSFHDTFPGLLPAGAGGWGVPGETYQISYTDLRERLLPREPSELELTVIELEDGRGSLSMVCRSDPAGLPGVTEITEPGGWREYLAKRAAR
ncbi:gamma-glutamylcyclotransferase [Nonomuraea sp. NPDC049714]|uniref:allophanate hydrolase-related protein n=1 Tax=Nonomuraea sp. NPDC049714 TaxID=3364357 RepID=UPI00379DE5E4